MPPPAVIRLTFAFALLVTASGASARDYERQARKAQQAAAPAVTIFIDVHWGGREDRAAGEISTAHLAFAQHGYEVVDVEAYTENGDLQGFFVTYRRR